MKDVNIIVVGGNLTGDPRFREVQVGSDGEHVPVASFRIANNGYKEGDTIFLDVEVWRKGAEICANLAQKGTKVFVEGRLTMETWQDKNGSERITPKVAASTVHYIDRLKPKTSEADDAGYIPPKAAPPVTEDEPPF